MSNACGYFSGYSFAAVFYRSSTTLDSFSAADGCSAIIIFCFRAEQFFMLTGCIYSGYSTIDSALGAVVDVFKSSFLSNKCLTRVYPSLVATQSSCAGYLAGSWYYAVWSIACVYTLPNQLTCRDVNHAGRYMVVCSYS